MVKNNSAKYSVTFKILAKYHMKRDSNCGMHHDRSPKDTYSFCFLLLTMIYLTILCLKQADMLAEYETKDVLFHFGGGILYNRQVNQTRRKMIDSELTKLRIAGTVSG